MRQPAAEVVGADEPAGEDRAADRGQAHDRPERTERGGHLLVAEHLLDHAEALRQHDGAEQALQDARAVISMSGDWANAQSSDASTKPPAPIMNMRLRP